MIERGSHISAERYISYLLGNRTYLEVELDVPGRVSQARAARSRFGQAKGGEKMSGKDRDLHEILSPPNEQKLCLGKYQISIVSSFLAAFVYQFSLVSCHNMPTRFRVPGFIRFD